MLELSRYFEERGIEDWKENFIARCKEASSDPEFPMHAAVSYMLAPGNEHLNIASHKEGNNLVYKDKHDQQSGVLEDPKFLCSTFGDYSPSNPWDAPGMSVRDFI